jgi:hypothetical protein
LLVIGCIHNIKRSVVADTQLVCHERLMGPVGFYVRQKRLFRSLYSLVLIHNKASNTHPHLTAIFSVLWLRELLNSLCCQPVFTNKLKCTIIRDMMPYSPVYVYRCFELTYCIHLQGRRVSPATRKKQAAKRVRQKIRHLTEIYHRADPH